MARFSSRGYLYSTFFFCLATTLVLILHFIYLSCIYFGFIVAFYWFLVLDGVVRVRHDTHAFFFFNF